MKAFRAWVLTLSLLVSTACATTTPTPSPTATPAPLAATITLANWADYMPQSVLDKFTAETGVVVQVVPYGDQGAVVAELEAGQSYDVVVMGNDYIPRLVAAGLLARLEPATLSNFENIAPNFRDLSYDPGNQYTAPYMWGTTGLLVRTDQVTTPIRRWRDLWSAELPGRVGSWEIQSYLWGVSLKSLGYSANSTNPAELRAAIDQLILLKQRLYVVDDSLGTLTPDLAAGHMVVGIGWPYDAATAQAEGLAVTYVLPTDGTILWGDNLVIPSQSPHAATARVFINFLLRGDVGGEIVNALSLPLTTDTSRAYVQPAILNDPMVYPPLTQLTNAEMLMPVDAAGQALRAALWEEYVQAPSP